MSEQIESPHVVVVGGGFAGVACAQRLAKHDIRVTLIDRNTYHQFQPLLYQVATSQLAPTDVMSPLRGVFRRDPTVDIKEAEVSSVDLKSRTVTTAEGQSHSGDYLVIAVGAEPNFFGVTGAETFALPMYSVPQARRLRNRVLQVFEDADRDPSLLDKGALTFVIVGGGATGVETAGALADLINDVLPLRYRDLALDRARILLVDAGAHLLGGFSDKAHDYAQRVLADKHVDIQLGRSVQEVAVDHVLLDDGNRIDSHCVVWAGGNQGAPLLEAAGLPTGRGHRVDVSADLVAKGYEDVYVVGDCANIPGADGSTLPQLGSVAMQAGDLVGRRIHAQVRNKSLPAFDYHDKGIMAMIGKGAAVAEMGKHRHELHGPIAFSAWLGVHAYLLGSTRERTDAFMSWAWDSFSANRSPAVIDDPDTARIDWHTDEAK